MGNQILDNCNTSQIIKNPIYKCNKEAELAIIKADISKLIRDKVNISDIVDDLKTEAIDKPLSANQGKVLNDRIDDIITGEVKLEAENIEYTYGSEDVISVQQALDDIFDGTKIVDKASKDSLGNVISDTYDTLNTDKTISGLKSFTNIPQTSGKQIEDFNNNNQFINKEYSDSKDDSINQDLQTHKSRVDNPHEVTKAQVGLGNVTNEAQVKRTEMGVANGVATLDNNGKVPLSQISDSVSSLRFTCPTTPTR